MQRRRERLSLCRIDDDVPFLAELLGDGAFRGLLGHMHEQLHPGGDLVRLREARDLHARRERLLRLRHACRLPRHPHELHGRGRGRELHLQHGPGMHERERDLRKHHQSRDVRAGHAGLLLRSLHVALHERSRQRHARLQRLGLRVPVQQRPVELRRNVRQRGVQQRELRLLRSRVRDGHGVPELRLRVHGPRMQRQLPSSLDGEQLRSVVHHGVPRSREWHRHRDLQRVELRGLVHVGLHSVRFGVLRGLDRRGELRSLRP